MVIFTSIRTSSDANVKIVPGDEVMFLYPLLVGTVGIVGTLLAIPLGRIGEPAPGQSPPVMRAMYVGLVFAIVVLAFSVVSFPMLLDRNVGPGQAVMTSIRAVLANPVTMAIWGIIVAVVLVVGAVPFFLGLAVVLPVLGHATWHLYRKVVVS